MALPDVTPTRARTGLSSKLSCPSPAVALAQDRMRKSFSPKHITLQPIQNHTSQPPKLSCWNTPAVPPTWRLSPLSTQLRGSHELALPLPPWPPVVPCAPALAHFLADTLIPSQPRSSQSTGQHPILGLFGAEEVPK